MKELPTRYYYDFSKYFYASQEVDWLSDTCWTAKLAWCRTHTSTVRKLFFKREAYYFYCHYHGWGFEKESDRNWFLLRWS